MRPKASGDASGGDLFRPCSRQMIDSRHELVLLAELIDWSHPDAEFDDFFHPSRAAPAVPTRTIAGLRCSEARLAHSPTRTSSGAGSRTLAGNISAGGAASVTGHRST